MVKRGMGALTFGLCAPEEQILMAGRMQHVKRGATSTTYVPNGKYASLCTNSADEGPLKTWLNGVFTQPRPNVDGLGLGLGLRLSALSHASPGFQSGL